MVMECTSFIQGILMLVNGLMGRAMVLEYRLVLMAAVTLVNSKMVSSMDLGVTISGMEIDMQGNILEI